MLTLCHYPVSDTPIHTELSPPRVLSLIECLPVELLVDIFLGSRPPPKISADKGPFDETVAECQRPPPNWAPLMVVSHRFCDVIVSTPLMWSRVAVTRNLGALRQRLKRSGELPIDLLLKDSCERIAISVILPHASRIRTIATAPNFSPHNLRFMIPLFHLALPALEEVYIPSKMDTYRHDQNWVIGTHLALNDTLHPRVKRLSSECGILPSPESTFWSLQLLQLDLRSQEVTAERRDDIVKILEASPLLESLAITYPTTLPEADFFLFAFGQPGAAPQIHHSYGPYRGAPAPMKRLQMLRLSCPITLCATVLHSFDMPSLQKLYINTCPDIGNPEASVVDMFPTRLRQLLAQHTRLHIHAAPDGGGFRLGDCLCDTGRVSSDRFYLRLQSLGAATPLRSPLGVLRRVFGDARLEQLEVSYYVREAAAESTERWREVLQTFNGLKRVALRKNDKRSGSVMVNDIKALQGEGLNPEMVLVDENTDW